jgi:hypothetical protein
LPLALPRGRPRYWYWQLVLLIGWTGCTNVPAGIVPVSGQVTLDGQPLAGAAVTFQPMSDRGEGSPKAVGSTGRTNADGRFTLTLIDPPVPGAVAGRHRVTVTTATTAADDAARPTGERVPKSWRDGSQSIEVPPQGTAAAQIDIKSG